MTSRLDFQKGEERTLLVARGVYMVSWIYRETQVVLVASHRRLIPCLRVLTLGRRLGCRPEVEL